MNGIYSNSTSAYGDYYLYFDPSFVDVSLNMINLGRGGATYNAIIGGTAKPTYVNATSPPYFNFTAQNLTTTTAWQSYNYFRLPKPAVMIDSFSYCAWFKTSNVGLGVQHYTLLTLISSEVPGNGNDFGIGIDSSGKLLYGDSTTSAGSTINVTTSVTVNDSTWTFVAITRDISVAGTNGIVTLYINGVYNASGICNKNSLSSTNNYLMIGSEEDSGGRTWGQALGSVYGYSRVLSSQNVLSLYNSTKNKYK